MSGTAYSLDIQKFLKGFHSMDTGIQMLTSKFAINVTQNYLRFGDGGGEVVWLFNYDPLKAHGHIKIENEARGLILNDKADIVSMSFSRFFNDHEPYAAKIDWTNANAEFKHDGTLIVVYAYKGNYFIQTRGRANADGRLPGDPSRTYYDAAFNILKRWADRPKGNGDPFGMFKKHNPGEIYTWAFEYVGPDNRIVTPYEEEDLILIAAFNKNVPAEVRSHYVDQFAYTFDIPRPGFMRIPDIEATYELLDRINVLEEGVIVTDYYNRRIKVKKPSYRAMARIEQTQPEDLSARQFAEVVLHGESGYVSDHYPEYTDILDFLNETVEDLMEELQTMWLLYRIAPDRKTFAEHVKSHPFSHILFLAWTGEIKDMTDALKYIKPNQLVELATEYHAAAFNRAFEKAVKARMERDSQGSEKEAISKNASKEA